MQPKELWQYSPHHVLKDYLQKTNSTLEMLVFQTKLTPTHIQMLIDGRGYYDADTSIRLGLYFGLQPDYFAHLQTQYDVLKQWYQSSLAQSQFYATIGGQTPGYILAASQNVIDDTNEIPF